MQNIEISLEQLKDGDKGTITRWVNQGTYVGNKIKMYNGKLIMTDKGGFKTESIDTRFPHFCWISLDK